MVWQSRLEYAGILCDPFWKHADPFEGNFYHDYITEHPDFTLGLRQTVAEMLVAAQNKLPDTWKIVLRAGYRPPSVQQAIFDAFCDETAQANPKWTTNQVLEHARSYVSDPNVVTPPHCTGGAVDVDILNAATKELIDFGAPINATSPKSHLDATGLTAEQQSNRKKLHDAMLSVGFAPLASEWWHFQYGEKLWADYYGHESPIYDIIQDI